MLRPACSWGMDAAESRPGRPAATPRRGGRFLLALLFAHVLPVCCSRPRLVSGASWPSRGRADHRCMTAGPGPGKKTVRIPLLRAPPAAPPRLSESLVRVGSLPVRVGPRRGRLRVSCPAHPAPPSRRPRPSRPSPVRVSASPVRVGPSAVRVGASLVRVGPSSVRVGALGACRRRPPPQKRRRTAGPGGPVRVGPVDDGSGRAGSSES